MVTAAAFKLLLEGNNESDDAKIIFSETNTYIINIK